MATVTTPPPTPSTPRRSQTPSPVTPPPKPSSKGQYILHRQKMPPKTIDPYDVKNIYRSEKDIQRAIAKGTFTHSKVMHMDWNNKNCYFLCYDN